MTDKMTVRNWSKERLGWRYYPTVYWYVLGRFFRFLLRRAWQDFTYYWTGQPDCWCYRCGECFSSRNKEMDCPHKRIDN